MAPNVMIYGFIKLRLDISANVFYSLTLDSFNMGRLDAQMLRFGARQCRNVHKKTSSFQG